MDRDRLQAALTSLADGDRSAFDDVFDDLWPLVRAVAARHAEAADADDIAQSALVKVFFRVGEFDRERDAIAWTLGIVAWEVRSQRQRRRRRREQPLDESAFALPHPDASAEAVMLESEWRAALDVALASLSAADREAIAASLAGDRPSGSSYRKRLQRAIERLRAQWRMSDES